MWNTAAVSGGCPRDGTRFDTGGSYYRSGYKQEISDLRRDPLLANEISRMRGSGSRPGRFSTLAHPWSGTRIRSQRDTLRFVTLIHDEATGSARSPERVALAHSRS